LASTEIHVTTLNGTRTGHRTHHPAVATSQTRACLDDHNAAGGTSALGRPTRNIHAAAGSTFGAALSCVHVN